MNNLCNIYFFELGNIVVILLFEKEKEEIFDILIVILLNKEIFDILVLNHLALKIGSIP